MGWSTVFEVFRNCYELPIQVLGLIMSPTSWAKGQRSAWCIEPHRGSILCGECSATVSAGVSFATWYPHGWCISSIFQHILKHHIPHQEASNIFLWAWLLSYIWLWVQAAFSAFWIPNTWKEHQRTSHYVPIMTSCEKHYDITSIFRTPSPSTCTPPTFGDVSKSDRQRWRKWTFFSALNSASALLFGGPRRQCLDEIHGLPA